MGSALVTTTPQTRYVRGCGAAKLTVQLDMNDQDEIDAMIEQLGGC